MIIVSLVCERQYNIHDFLVPARVPNGLCCYASMFNTPNECRNELLGLINRLVKYDVDGKYIKITRRVKSK